MPWNISRSAYKPVSVPTRRRRKLNATNASVLFMRNLVTLTVPLLV
jgi:hypothetical protein